MLIDNAVSVGEFNLIVRERLHYPKGTWTSTEPPMYVISMSPDRTDIVSSFCDCCFIEVSSNNPNIGKFVYGSDCPLRRILADGGDDGLFELTPTADSHFYEINTNIPIPRPAGLSVRPIVPPYEKVTYHFLKH